MKAKPSFIFILVLLSITAYSQVSEKNRAIANSLVESWNVGFGSDDPKNIAMILTSRVTMMSGDTYYAGKDSVMGKFVEKRMPLISRLNAVNQYYRVSKDMVYTAGRYSLEVKRKEGNTDTSYGNFTFIWLKQKDNSYKIDFLHIESIPKQ